jgi:hypothetical protein
MGVILSQALTKATKTRGKEIPKELFIRIQKPGRWKKVAPEKHYRGALLTDGVKELLVPVLATVQIRSE